MGHADWSNNTRSRQALQVCAHTRYDMKACELLPLLDALMDLTYIRRYKESQTMTVISMCHWQ